MYDEKANVNYTFIFCLYLIAQRDKKENIYNTISFQSQKELAEKVNKYNDIFSISTINRILNDKIYFPYFSYDKINKTIILNNNFKKGKTQTNKFVILNDNELLFLISQNDKLLNKYFLYLKYYIGFSKDKKIDTTANQILSAMGYNNKSGNNKEKLCKYNSLLLDKGFLNIQKIKDNNGYCRNIYSMSL